MGSLKGKTVVITGASTGIGRAAAVLLGSRGARLVLAARNRERLEELCESLTSSGVECLPVPTDVADPEQVENLFNAAQEAFGHVEVLVNNAGIGLQARLLDTGYGQWNSVIGTNLTGAYLCCREAAQRMVECGRGGSIILVSSVAGWFSAPLHSAYCASKHGLTGFYKSIKRELRREGIRVWAIFPYRTDTEFFTTYENPPGRREMLHAEDVALSIVARAEGAAGRVWWLRVRNFMKRLLGLAGLPG
ncbi:MAG: SDR family oxidoreductase [Candidatus Latescibacteria bacterium]|nr:SDR family oxidoreductase [Candidatus Latescibacterota bacterium]